MHFIYYINRSITTSADSTLLTNNTQRIGLVATGEGEPVTSISLSCPLTDSASHVDRI